MQPGLDQEDIRQEGDTTFCTLTHQNRSSNLELERSFLKLPSPKTADLRQNTPSSAAGDEAQGERVSCKEQDKHGYIWCHIRCPLAPSHRNSPHSNRTVIFHSVPESRVPAFPQSRNSVSGKCCHVRVNPSYNVVSKQH